MTNKTRVTGGLNSGFYGVRVGGYWVAAYAEYRMARMRADACDGTIWWTASALVVGTMVAA